MLYNKKYIKYKTKFLNLKNFFGGECTLPPENENEEDPLMESLGVLIMQMMQMKG